MIYNTFKYMAAALLVVLAFAACSEDKYDDFKLSGDISELFPDYATSLGVSSMNVHDGWQYVKLRTELKPDLDVFNLKVKQVKYYIDGNAVGTATTTTAPYSLDYRTKTLSEGSHTAKMEMTITGDDCDDAVITKTGTFQATKAQTMQRTGDFDIVSNRVARGGTLVVTPTVNADRSAKGCKINSVKYTWNGSVTTTSKAPFDLRADVAELGGRSYVLSVAVNYSTSASSNLSYTYSTYVKVLDENDFEPVLRLKSSSRAYRRSESVNIAASVYHGKSNTDKAALKIYFDGKEIAASDSEAFDYSYKLAGATVGIHTLKATWTVDKGGGVTTANSREEDIVVTE